MDFSADRAAGTALGIAQLTEQCLASSPPGTTFQPTYAPMRGHDAVANRQPYCHRALPSPLAPCAETGCPERGTSCSPGLESSPGLWSRRSGNTGQVPYAHKKSKTYASSPWSCSAASRGRCGSWQARSPPPYAPVIHAMPLCRKPTAQPQTSDRVCLNGGGSPAQVGTDCRKVGQFVPTCTPCDAHATRAWRCLSMQHWHPSYQQPGFCVQMHPEWHGTCHSIFQEDRACRGSCIYSW